MEIGDSFQQETKYEPEKLGGHSLDWAGRPKQFKSHENAIETISLPEPSFGDERDIWSILQNRRSERRFNAEKELPLNTLSVLLWATQGLTARAGDTFFRAAPSAGALYPIETYFYARSVESIKKGIYHFRPDFFDLEFLREGDFSRSLSDAALGQAMVTRAQITFIWSAVVERSKWKYRQRAYRYIYLDAGHIAENLYLAAEALNLSTCTIGAFFDDYINSIIAVDGIEETVLYMAVAGIYK